MENSTTASAVQNSTLIPSTLPLLSDNPLTTTQEDGGGGGSSYVGVETVFTLLANHPLFQAAVLLYRVTLPVIILAGVLGNTLILVLQTRLDREGGGGSSLSVLIMALAVSDSVMLVVSGSSWFAAFTFQIAVHNLNDVFCKLVVWAIYTSGLTSPWLLVAMTVQRAMSIVWPHLARAVLTVKTGLWTVVILVSGAVLLNAHMLYGRRLEVSPTGESLCLFVSEDYLKFFDTVWPVVDVVASSFLPFLLLIASNLVLVSRVRQSLKEVKDNLMVARGDQMTRRQEKASSMTLTLVCVSLAFLLLTSPLCFFFVLQRTGSHMEVQDLDDAARNFLAEAVGNVLWLSNTAINLYIYVATGSRYRAALLQLFSCRTARGSA